MKTIIKFFACIFFSGPIAVSSCRKKNDTPPPIPLLKSSTINFHIKDSSVLDWGEPVYLSHLVFISYSNDYNPSENIFLRPNIDTAFSFKVAANTNNQFTVGGAPFDGVLIYKEQKFILAGSNVNWEIVY